MTQSISVPDSVSRVPKTILDHVYWKGNIYTKIAFNCDLYVNIPVLEGVLPLVYLRHWVF